MISQPRKPSADRKDERRPDKRRSLDELDVVVEVEYAKPGTRLDDQLRREQASALLALLAVHKSLGE